ncbi:spermatogenesis-associated protein 6 isoform X1 [Epargyreus clarus]|uniref:spermatogenesis-associated protein 6 isoform X1 n=1 Tax=Epargyreus clarus TaxID=520877 RepID=UPI003C2F5B8B
MPKIIELTIELEVQRVSCPGVWLCQDGRVSLSVFALGTSYQTCLLPPNFPLVFKDVFYFRKRFQESCALNNICCLLRDETIYCELIQWCQDCNSEQCVVLAQYLGSLNDVLFPPNMCSMDGVDLLMRRSKQFPGILAPKIEIATKVRIDEVWNHLSNMNAAKAKTCHCSPRDVEASRQKQVCHTAQYHRNKCSYHRRPTSVSRSRSRSRSSGSRSCCSLDKNPGSCRCPNPTPSPRACVSRPCSPRGRRACREYSVYTVATADNVWPGGANEREDLRTTDTVKPTENVTSEDRIQKLLLESRYIEQDQADYNKVPDRIKKCNMRITPCVCEICKRYHELFHTDWSES